LFADFLTSENLLVPPPEGHRQGPTTRFRVETLVAGKIPAQEICNRADRRDRPNWKRATNLIMSPGVSRTRTYANSTTELGTANG